MLDEVMLDTLSAPLLGTTQNIATASFWNKPTVTLLAG